jgi:hypothetical protein
MPRETTHVQTIARLTRERDEARERLDEAVDLADRWKKEAAHRAAEEREMREVLREVVAREERRTADLVRTRGGEPLALLAELDAARSEVATLRSLLDGDARAARAQTECVRRLEADLDEARAEVERLRRVED